MKKLTEKNIIKLGFEKIMVSGYESGANEFYYYIYRIDEDTILISNDDHSIKVDGVWVAFFEHESLGTYNNYNVIKNLIKILNQGG